MPDPSSCGEAIAPFSSTSTTPARSARTNARTAGATALAASVLVDALASDRARVRRTSDAAISRRARRTVARRARERPPGTPIYRTKYPAVEAVSASCRFEPRHGEVVLL